MDAITALVAAEVIARRSPAVDSASRRNLSVRSLALASVGVPPALAVVDAQNRVRRLERAVPPVVGPVVGGLGFQATGVRIARDLAVASDLAQDQLEKAEAAWKESDIEVKAQKKALEAAKEQADQLQECAAAVGEVFPTG